MFQPSEQFRINNTFLQLIHQDKQLGINDTFLRSKLPANFVSLIVSDISDRTFGPTEINI